MRDPITAMDLHTIGLWYRIDDIDQALAFEIFLIGGVQVTIMIF